MLFLSRWALSVVLSLALTSCTVYRIDVNGYLKGGHSPPLAPGASVLIVQNPKADNPLLEQEVASKIEKLLEEKGYRIPISDTSAADFYLVFGYAIGPGLPRIEVIPIYRPGGTAIVDTYNSTTGERSWGTVQLPGSTSYVSHTVTIHTRALTIRVVDARKFRETGQVEVVWAGDTTSEGRSGDLREAVNYLLVATLDQFGQNTGNAVRTRLTSGDERANRLKGL